MDNDIREKVESIAKRLKELEDSLIKLKEEEKDIILYIINKGNGGQLSEEERALLNSLEDQISNIDAERRSTFVAKNLTDINVKIFVSLNHMVNKDETDVKNLIEELVANLNGKNLDERYIEFLEYAKKFSAIVEDPSTFTMIVLDSGKTYAYAEGKANIYSYNNGYITPLNLSNKIGELSYEVLNNQDYIRLVLFTYCNEDDLTDEKVKIITKKTRREELIKELI